MATSDEMTDRLTEIALGFLPPLYQEKVMDYCEDAALNVKQRMTLALRLADLWEVQVFSLVELEELLPRPQLVTLTEEQERALDDVVAVLVEVSEHATV